MQTDSGLLFFIPAHFCKEKKKKGDLVIAIYVVGRVYDGGTARAHWEGEDVAGCMQ